MTSPARRRSSTAAVLAVTGAALATLLGPAWPAWAHDGAPHGSLKVSPGGVISDTTTPTVTGTFEVPLEEITSLTLVVKPKAGQAVPNPGIDGCGSATAGRCGTSSISVSWKVPSLAYNGPYVLEATLGHRLLGLLDPAVGPATAPVSFSLAVPPQPPQGLKAEVRPDRSVRLQWNRNIEPDLIGYVIERKSGSGDFAPVPGGFAPQPATGSVSFVDQTAAQAGGASYTYRVQAGRAGAVPDDTSQAVASEFSGAATVNMPPPAGDQPVPTTAPISIPTSVPLAGGGKGSSSLDLSRFTGSAPARPSTNLTVPEITLPDSGFSETLPFGPLPDQEEAAAASEADESEPGDGSDGRALLVPIAAGAALCVLALQLRLIMKRLSPAGAARGDLPDFASEFAPTYGPEFSEFSHYAPVVDEPAEAAPDTPVSPASPMFFDIESADSPPADDPQLVGSGRRRPPGRSS